MYLIQVYHLLILLLVIAMRPFIARASQLKLAHQHQNPRNPSDLSACLWRICIHGCWSSCVRFYVNITQRLTLPHFLLTLIHSLVFSSEQRTFRSGVRVFGPRTQCTPPNMTYILVMSCTRLPRHHSTIQYHPIQNICTGQLIQFKGCI